MTRLQPTIHVLEPIMAQVNGASIIAIDTVTLPPLLGGKENPHIGRVRKHVVGSNVMVFQNKRVNGYDAMVRRRLQQEGKDPQDFILSPRQWGTRMIGMPFVEHKGRLYLEVIFLRAGQVFYSLDNEQIDREFIHGLNERATEAEQGGLNNKVIIRTYAVENIAQLKINSQTYTFM